MQELFHINREPLSFCTAEIKKQIKHFSKYQIGQFDYEVHKKDKSITLNIYWLKEWNK